MANDQPQVTSLELLERRMTRLERIVLGDAEAKQPGIFELLSDLKKGQDSLNTDRTRLFAMWGVLAVVFTVVGWAIATFHNVGH